MEEKAEDQHGLEQAERDLLADLRRARRSLRLQAADEPPNGGARDAGARDCGRGRHRHGVMDLHRYPERDPVRLSIGVQT